MSWDPRHTPPDVAVLVESLEAFERLANFVSLRPVSNDVFGADDYAFEVAADAGRSYRCVATFVDRMGIDATVHATQRLMGWRPACLVSLGVAASTNSERAKIGDVIVVGRVESDADGTILSSDSNLARLVKQLPFSYPGFYRHWQDQGAAERDSIPNSRNLTDLRESPVVVSANLVSGPVVSTPDLFLRDSKTQSFETVAIEMDASSILAATRHETLPTVLLRGITELPYDVSVHPTVRAVAINNTIRLLLAVLRTGRFPRIRATTTTSSRDLARTSNARLTSLTIERFKSYDISTQVELAPLTVILGRNNGGKSTLIQALLLLKQTVAHRRQEVPLHLDGPVDALTLRELTYGWPAEAPHVQGPRFTLRWRSGIDLQTCNLAATHVQAVDGLLESTGLNWLKDRWHLHSIETELDLTTAEVNGRAIVERAALTSFGPEGSTHRLVVDRDNGAWRCRWDDKDIEHFRVEFEHFLPYLRLDGQRISHIEQRGWHAAYLVLFEQPLDALKRILEGMQYLGSTRTLPPSVYRSTGVPPEDLGVGGEYAAEIIHAHQSEHVHYMAPLTTVDSGVEVDAKVHARPFIEAVNDVLAHLGVTSSLRLQDVPNIGFRLLFGNANLPHVGRGLTYLLPLVELGLFADPLRFRGEAGEMTLEQYKQACSGYTHIAFEEPEAHLHPKVQTRLAHWMVALAMANRQLMVETHSDHLVRRLRGLMARAEPGSELETWLRENVSIIEVEQQDGRSSIRTSRLTPDGSMADHWPADFMDEASEEESRIYYAALDKPSPAPETKVELSVEHDVGEEPEPAEEP